MNGSRIKTWSLTKLDAIFKLIKKYKVNNRDKNRY